MQHPSARPFRLLHETTNGSSKYLSKITELEGTNDFVWFAAEVTLDHAREVVLATLL